MALSSELYVGQLFLRMVAHQTGEISNVDYKPQKPSFPESAPEGEVALPRSTPEEQGVSSEWVDELFHKLHTAPEANMHKIMVMRHGVVIGEAAFAPFDMDHWHVTHSMCKSVTGMAIGILVGEGRIKVTDKVIEILSDKRTINSMLRLRDLTVEHLLDMTSGVQFNETGAVSGNDWIKGYLDSNTSFSAGSMFSYNSMNSYILSAIVTKLTGKSLFEFVNERIFEPLGIRRVFWEADPQGITKGGWGLLLRIEDMCKLGQLYLQRGRWGDQQIVPEDWVIQSTMPHILTDVVDAPAYGYQLWCLRGRDGSYIFNGMLGQNVYIYPDIDMVIATNAGNSEIFQQGQMASIIEDMTMNIEASDSPLAPNPAAVKELNRTCRILNDQAVKLPTIIHGGWNRNPIPHMNYYDLMMRLHALDGCSYDVGDSGIGVLPLMVQLIHNNFTDGISRISFKILDKNRFAVVLYEGDQVYTLPCGIDDSGYPISVNMHGEIYNGHVISRFATDEYGRMVIMIRIKYLEEPNERRMNIYLGSKYADVDTRGIHGRRIPDGIDVHFSEYPGNDIMSKALKGITDTPTKGIEGIVISKLQELGAINVLDTSIHYTISPRIHGTLIADTDITE